MNSPRCVPFLVAAVFLLASAEVRAECGNGVLEFGELCDDGNIQAGDGCSAACRIEEGWSCSCPAPTFTYGNTQKAGEIGGSGGEEGDQLGCAPDEVLIGIQFRFSKNEGTAARTIAHCGKVSVDPVTKTVTTTPTLTHEDGGSGCGGWEDMELQEPALCESGWAIVGMEGLQGLLNGDLPTLFHDVKITCAALGVDGTPTENRKVLVVPGTHSDNSTGPLQTVSCPTGTIGRYFLTRAGCGQDALELHCGIPEPTCAEQKSICATTCGDGVLAGTEDCDDGNLKADDGCAADCTVECGWLCAESPGDTSLCVTTCGDGKLAPVHEACDDGNGNPGDGCDGDCQVEPGYACSAECGFKSTCTKLCGNGILDPQEQCDDGNSAMGDGCSDDCWVECGYECHELGGMPSLCLPVCGDGNHVGKEACDDGNTQEGDGCSPDCTVEEGYECSEGGCQKHSECTPKAVCGNGKREFPEGCDDGNLLPHDGCDETCDIEIGFYCGCAAPQFEYGDETFAGRLGGEGGDVGPKMGCTGREVLIGLQFEFSMETLTATRTIVYCGEVTVTPDGTVTTTEKGSQKSGGAGCSGWDPSPLSAKVLCPSGWSVVGLRGQMPGATLFQDVSVVCGRLGPDGKPTGETLTVFVEGTESLAGGEPQVVDCPAGTIGTYFQTRAGCGQDALDLYCAYPVVTCDGQKSTCATVCGDGVKAGAESCDDGNVAEYDGCSAKCDVECGWDCVAPYGKQSECASHCGDGAWAPGAEKCDDKNTENGDGCDASCKVETGWECENSCGKPSDCEKIYVPVCGNGIRDSQEACDDGNLKSGDGCNAECGIECGFQCDAPMGQKSACAPVCGDGKRVVGIEACDDGNKTAGDGCSPQCTVEEGWACAGGDCENESACSRLAVCGNGKLEATEGCDDGNTVANDGCSAACGIESGFQCGCAAPVFQYSGEELAGRLGGVGGEPGPKMGCPDREVLIGLKFDFSDATKTVTRTTIYCGEVSVLPDGTVTTTETESQTSGGTGCSEWDPSTATPKVLCPSGWAIVGLRGLRDGDTLFHDVSVVCGRLGPNGKPTGETTTLEVQGTTGAADGTAQVVNCPAGTLGTFFQTRAGCGQDALDLYCAAPKVTCDGQKSVCKAVCGNASLDLGETCDDGNVFPGDGCDGLCRIECGFSCEGDFKAKSTCTRACGDGLLYPGKGPNDPDAETCDDGNTLPGDGCSADCKVEKGFKCSGECGFKSECWAWCEECQQCGAGCEASCPDGYQCTGDGLCFHETNLNVAASADSEALSHALVVPETGITVVEHAYSGAACQSGTFTNGPLGIGDGILVTTGLVRNALPPNDSEGISHAHPNGVKDEPYCVALAGTKKIFDAAKLTVTFTLAEGYKGIRFGYMFGSDEYKEYVGQFNDVGGVFLDGVNVAKDANGADITINGPFFSGTQVITNNGTEYDGATPFLKYCSPLASGTHTIEVVICDAMDAAYDSGMFVAGLEGIKTNCDGTLHWCGDGVQDPGEECDDHNTVSGDGCDSNCRLEYKPACGNGIRDPGEACDDGDKEPGDGCGPSCSIECGWICEGGVGVKSECFEETPLCGDGRKLPSEACDDGNTEAGDGCGADCAIEDGFECSASCGGRSHCTKKPVVPVCGNGKKEVPEDCDDGNKDVGDGCDAACRVEAGWTCVEDANQQSTCTENPVEPVCGDGKKESPESCDDGNTASGDGCDKACRVEAGWACVEDANLRSKCTKIPTGPVCGDGKKESPEACDDGNTAAKDGCDATCKIEEGFACTGDEGAKSVCTALPPCEDKDQDGICDSQDNCPDVANPDQRDWNFNGIGDACEPGLEFKFSGGACSASPGSAGTGIAGALVLAGLAGLAFLGLRRRSPFRRGVAGLIIVATIAGGAASAEADTIDVQAFRPSPFVQDLFTVETGETDGPCWWCAGLYLNYQSDPFVLRAIQGDDETIVRKIIKHQITANLLASFRVARWFAVGLDVPVVVWQKGETLPGMSKPGAFGLGDVRVYPRFRLLSVKDGLFTLGFSPTIIVPVGGLMDDYMGRDNIAFLPTVMAGFDLGRFGFAIDAGALVSLAKAKVANLDVQHLLQLKAGARVTVVDKKLDLIAEASTATSLKDPFGDTHEMPLEVGGGLTWHAVPGVDINAGGGGGLSKGVTAPVYRMFAGVQFFCPPPPPPPEPVRDPDPDHDGICDPWVKAEGKLAKYACHGSDQCPAIPEDKDGFADDDGCPDPDNDNDGICDPWVAEKGEPDAYKDVCRLSDSCPDAPEDKDGFEDDNGCPDPDNDKDGICDPWVAEKGLQDTYKDKCRLSDKCPMEPETVNSFEDDDGCPDKAVQITKKKVVILQTILFYFDKTQIKEESFPLLNEVTQTLKDNPQLRKLRIEAHTDERGEAKYNQKLSEGRAKAVYDYLVSHGIDASRLTSQGFGAARPLVKNAKTEDDHQKNRRVEFVILEQD